MQSNLRTVLSAAAFGLPVLVCLSPVAIAQAKVSFQRQVLPILEKSCMSCHKGPHKDPRGRTRKPKSGLRLDGRGWILKGGKGGAAVVPGKPERSPLYTLTSLDANDPDIMPAKGDPLTEKQTELLRRWIVEGCDFGSWKGKPGPAAAVVKAAQESAKGAVLSTSRIAVWSRLGEGLAPPLPQAVKRAAGQKCQVEPIVPGSPLLRVAYVSNEASVGDGDLDKLRPLMSHITKLVLAKTRITDAALSAVGQMKRLTRLDLNRTRITDRGLRQLTGLTELRYLNLHSTAVTDEGVRALGQLPNLEAVYLWNTKVSKAGVRALRGLLPKTKISHELNIPVVEEAPRRGANSRRRRRN